jgi:hypothetical protein
MEQIRQLHNTLVPQHNGLSSPARKYGLLVAILSSSKSPRERTQAEELGAAAYFQKPMSLDGYTDLADAFGELCQAFAGR